MHTLSMQLPHTIQRTSQQHPAAISTGVKAAILILVILNLAQLNLLSFTGQRSTCSTARSRREVHAAQVISSRGSSDSTRRTGSTAEGRVPEGASRIGASLPPPGQHFALFVIFSWNYDVLVTAIASYIAAGFGETIIIIDNSPDSQIASDDKVKGMVGEVIPTRTRLTFSQSQNFMAGERHCLRMLRMQWSAHSCHPLQTACLLLQRLPLSGSTSTTSGAIRMWRCWQRVQTHPLPATCWHAWRPQWLGPRTGASSTLRTTGSPPYAPTSCARSGAFD